MAAIISKLNALQKNNTTALSIASRLISRRTARPAAIKPVTVKFDSFKSAAADAMLKKLVQHVQTSLQQSVQNLTFSLLGGQNFGGKRGDLTFIQGSASMQFNTVRFLGNNQELLDEGIANAGGTDALQNWLVDGATVLDIRGFTMQAQLGDFQPAALAQTREEAAAQAEAAIARFGLTSDDLSHSPDEVRTSLRQAANRIKTEQQELGYNNSSAIDYALEDAFQKLSVYNSFVQGKGNPQAEAQQQRQTNTEQAESIKQQLNLGSGNWGIDSIAQDLAVFGMDFTSLTGDPKELVKSIKDKSQQMISSLDASDYGMDTSLIKARNTITGAASRLINGIEAGAVISGASATASISVNAFTGKQLASNTVTVGGVNIDANFLIGMGNVVVDPLVLDLNGDGIDLGAAEEGVTFDMDGTGQKDRMGFIRGDDAFLFVDSHGDGVVHDGRQLFGNSDGYANGFDKLREYDENDDGVIDEKDSIYDKLMVWQEKTEDGECEREETMTLREAGIASISLGYQNVREDDGKGNLTGQTGSFTRADGSEGYAADVWLRRTQGNL